MQIDKLIIFEHNGVRYVLRDEIPVRETLPLPNFKGTKKPLVGILKRRETLEGFVKRVNAMRKQIEKDAQKAIALRKRLDNETV